MQQEKKRGNIKGRINLNYCSQQLIMRSHYQPHGKNALLLTAIDSTSIKKTIKQPQFLLLFQMAPKNALETETLQKKKTTAKA